eukprot:gene23418-28416_t
MYVVYPGESQVVEANPDPIGLKVGLVYDTLSQTQEFLFHRFSCKNDSILTITDVEASDVDYYGEGTTLQAKNKLKEYELEPFNMAASTLNKETRSTALTTNVGQAGEEVKKFFKKVKDSGEQAIQKVTGKEVFRSDHSTMTPPPTSSTPPRPPFPQNVSRDEMSQLTDDNNNSVHPNFNSNFNNNNVGYNNSNSLPPFMTNNNYNTSNVTSTGGVTSGLRPFDKKSGAGMTGNDPITSYPSGNPSSSNNASSAASKLFSSSGFGGIDNTNVTNTTTTTTNITKGMDKNYGNTNGNSNGFGNNYNNAGGGVSSSNLSAMSAKPTNTTTGNTNSNFGNTNAFNANNTSTYNTSGNANNNYSSNVNPNANSGYNNATYIPSTPLSSPIPPPVKTQKEKEWEETLARIKRDREQGKSLGMEPPGGGKVDAQCSVCVIT